MKPGRELDVLVADKIFGLKMRDRFSGEERPITAVQVLAHFSNIEMIPRYSTDIAAAWEVVTKVSEVDKYSRDFMLKRWALPGLPLDWQYFALFRKDDADDGVEYSAFSESAPHAICLAALKAVGVDSASLG